MKKHEKILELDKIITLLREEVVLDANREMLDAYQDSDGETLLSNDLSEIERMLAETDEALGIVIRMGRFPLYFKEKVGDALHKAMKSGILSIPEIISIGKLMDTVKNCFLFRDKLKTRGFKHCFYAAYMEKLVYPKELNLRIKQVIDDNGEIKDTADPALNVIRQNIRNKEKSINDKMNELISRHASKLSQRVVLMRHDRYVIPVRSEFKNVVKGIIHDRSASGETFFIEPLVICTINNQLRSLREDEKKEIARILRILSTEIGTYGAELMIDYETICRIDLIFGKAQLALRYDGAKPKINDRGETAMLGCFHPLLNTPEIVKNNIVIGSEYKGIIITGPNTGGKTVLLKTVGLLSLMIKMGLLVPCRPESNLAVFDGVYADIGDEQNISQNLSTFSAHLRNIKEIIAEGNDNSLVLLDELGSGTDPQEGAALAIAVFDYLLARRCLVIATSHYAELKVHAFENREMINACVEFDAKTLRPTYKLLIGVPGTSNALQICEMLGMPNEIIEKAKHYVGNKANELRESLDKLTGQSEALEKKLNDLGEREEKLRMIEEETELMRQQTLSERNRILAEADLKAGMKVKESMGKINALMEDLQKLKNDAVKPHHIAEFKHRIGDLKAEAEPKPVSVFESGEIGIGDHVFAINYGAAGEVIGIDKNRYRIQIGNATATVNKEDLIPTKAEVKGRLFTSSRTFVPGKTVGASLNLRGLRYEDAEPLIDDYIDDARYAGLHRVTIIHGFGTGTLRELVQRKLKTNRNVESFRYGQQKEGGQGATIVTLIKE